MAASSIADSTVRNQARSALSSFHRSKGVSSLTLDKTVVFDGKDVTSKRRSSTMEFKFRLEIACSDTGALSSILNDASYYPDLIAHLKTTVPGAFGTATSMVKSKDIVRQQICLAIVSSTDSPSSNPTKSPSSPIGLDVVQLLDTTTTSGPVLMPATNVTEVDTAASSGGGGDSIGPIIGGAVGGILLVSLLIIVVMRRGTLNEERKNMAGPERYEMSEMGSPSYSENGGQGSIQVTNLDDILRNNRVIDSTDDIGAGRSTRTAGYGRAGDGSIYSSIKKKALGSDLDSTTGRGMITQNPMFSRDGTPDGNLRRSSRYHSEADDSPGAGYESLDEYQKRRSIGSAGYVGDPIYDDILKVQERQLMAEMQGKGVGSQRSRFLGAGNPYDNNPVSSFDSQSVVTSPFSQSSQQFNPYDNNPVSTLGTSLPAGSAMESDSMSHRSLLQPGQLRGGAAENPYDNSNAQSAFSSSSLGRFGSSMKGMKAMDPNATPYDNPDGPSILGNGTLSRLGGAMAGMQLDFEDDEDLTGSPQFNYKGREEDRPSNSQLSSEQMAQNLVGATGRPYDLCLKAVSKFGDDLPSILNWFDSVDGNGEVEDTTYAALVFDKDIQGRVASQHL